MPFVEPDRRPPLLTGDIAPTKAGDLCFLEYVPMKAAWDKERRWTTAHNVCQQTFGFSATETAKFLAFIEFYIRHVHPYENEMVEKNGDI